VLQLLPTLSLVLACPAAVMPFSISFTAPFHGQPCTAYSAWESFTHPDTLPNPPDDPTSTTTASAVLQTVPGGVITAQGNLDHLTLAPHYRITDTVAADLQEIVLQVSVSLNQMPWGNVTLTYLDGGGTPHVVPPSTSVHMLFQMGHEERLITWDLSASTDTILSYQIDIPAAFSFTTLDAVKLDTRVVCSPPVSYCTAKVNSQSCSPSITFTGSPSASATSGFVVTATNMLNNKSCLLFYGTTGQAGTPFQNGTLCVNGPVKRTPGTTSGGNPPPNDCSGAPAIDMNQFAHGGLGGSPLPALLVAGTVVDCQWWGRDPGFAAPNNTQLSNGLEYTVHP
jgi:hypothetical protein